MRRLSPVFSGGLLLAILLLGTASLSVAEAPAWKVPEGFQVKVIQYPMAGEPQVYDMHIVVTFLEKLEKSHGWRMEFIPIKPPGGLGNGYRIVLDPTSGSIVKMSERNSAKELTQPRIDRFPIAHDPPAGYPLEILTFMSPGEQKSKDGRYTFNLTRTDDGSHQIWEATIVRDKVEVLGIKQRWIAGEKWWRDYERRVNGRRDLAASLIQKEPTPTKDKEPLSKGFDFPLRVDPRLQANVSVNAVNPRRDTLFKLLENATHLSFTVAPALVDFDPDYGNVNLDNVKAFVVLEMIEKHQLRDGRWIKMGDTGYRLEGKPLVDKSAEPSVEAGTTGPSPTEPGPASRRWLTIATIIGIVVISLGIAVWRIRTSRLKAGVAPPHPAAGGTP